MFSIVTRGFHLLPITVILSLPILSSSSRAKLKLFSSDHIHEVSTRQCEAGAFMLEPLEYTCACVTGVWGFYSKFCKKPVMIIGGDNYCFKMDPLMKISQVIPFGNTKYPFDQSLSHFREDFVIMTRTFTTEYTQVDLDSSSTFVTVTHQPWTIRGGESKSLCLKGTGLNSNRVYCMYDLTRGQIDDWSTITDVQRGCQSENIVEADECGEIFPPNDEDLCFSLTNSRENGTSTSTEPTSGGQESTVDTALPFPTSTAESLITTTEGPNIPCDPWFTRTDLQSYWNSPLAATCPRSITELVFRDQLKRFAVLQMNRVVKTRQLSLEQTEELLGLQAGLMKITCPNYAVSPEFIDVATDAFGMFIRDDFFYGVEETDGALFERITYALRSCILRSRPFQFVTSADQCNTTFRIHDLIVDGSPVPVNISEKNRWRNYEPLIESGWKMFLNIHSYCYEDFLRQNDHHAFAVRMMKLFSHSIYEKWTQPLPTFALYKFIAPEANTLEITMDNLDQCVAALSYGVKCPLWLDRTSPRDMNSDNSGLQGHTSEPRQRRSIWITHLRNNRKQTKIWDGMAHCLQTPDDPSYFLGYGRCAHP